MREFLICFAIVAVIAFPLIIVLAAAKVASIADREMESIMKRHTEVTSGAVKTGGNPRKFYSIEHQDDGTVDVYLYPDVIVHDADANIAEKDIDVRVVRGVVPWDGLEADIRVRYSAWCESAKRLESIG